MGSGVQLSVPYFFDVLSITQKVARNVKEYTNNLVKRAKRASQTLFYSFCTSFFAVFLQVFFPVFYRFF